MGTKLYATTQHIQYSAIVKVACVDFQKDKKYNLIDPLFSTGLVLMCSDVSLTKTITGEFRVSSHWLVEFSVTVKNTAIKDSSHIRVAPVKRRWAHDGLDHCSFIHSASEDKVRQPNM